MERIPVETFDIPTQEVRRGYMSAVYFWRAKMIMEDLDPCPVTMQVFQKTDHAVICGTDESIALLRLGVGHWMDQSKANDLFDKYLAQKHSKGGSRKARNFLLAEIEDELDELWISTWGDVEVKAVADGDHAWSRQPVLQITGPYSEFAHLESLYLGVLARRTRVSTNVRNTITAANGKPVLYFADRFDHWSNQSGDGYAAHVGGAQSVATDSMGSWWGVDGMGTMPHALIACFGGSTLDATVAFHEKYPDVNLISLVDFNNDVIGDSLVCAEALGDSLWGVRVDTSETMVDSAFMSHGGEIPYPLGDYDPRGCNPQLVLMLRDALDKAGFHHVKIVVSGGFNPDKIRSFENHSVPVGAYAVGSSMLNNHIDFTADIVLPVAKRGRWYRENPKLQPVE